MTSFTDGETIALINNLYAQYAHALDNGDAQAFAGTFTADAIFQPNTGPFQPDLGSFSGSAIAGFVKATNAKRPRHLMLNVAVDRRSETEAIVQALFMLMDSTTGQQTAIGKYDDKVALENGTWKFQLKSASFVWQSAAQAERMSQMQKR